MIECSICYEHMDINKKVVLNCTHTLCLICYGKIINKNNPKCPFCRRNILKNNGNTNFQNINMNTNFQNTNFQNQFINFRNFNFALLNNRIYQNYNSAPIYITISIIFNTIWIFGLIYYFIKLIINLRNN